MPPPVPQRSGFGGEASASGAGVYGLAHGASAWAGYFDGAVHVNGSLSKSAGSFKIDHPLDPEHKYLYWEFSGYNQQQAVREGKWKILRSGVDIGDPAYELYDLSTDIGEQHNLATDGTTAVAGEYLDVQARVA